MTRLGCDNTNAKCIGWRARFSYSYPFSTMVFTLSGAQAAWLVALSHGAMALTFSVPIDDIPTARFGASRPRHITVAVTQASELSVRAAGLDGHTLCDDSGPYQRPAGDSEPCQFLPHQNRQWVLLGVCTSHTAASLDYQRIAKYDDVGLDTREPKEWTAQVTRGVWIWARWTRTRPALAATECGLRRGRGGGTKTASLPWRMLSHESLIASMICTFDADANANRWVVCRGGSANGEGPSVQPDAHFGPSSRTPGAVRPRPNMEWSDFNIIKVEIGVLQQWGDRAGQLDHKAVAVWYGMPGVQYVLCIKTDLRLTTAEYKLYDVHVRGGPRPPGQTQAMPIGPGTTVAFDAHCILGIEAAAPLPTGFPEPLVVDLYAALSCDPGFSIYSVRFV